jgi:hypothetical protein
LTASSAFSAAGLTAALPLCPSLSFRQIRYRYT